MEADILGVTTISGMAEFLGSCTCMLVSPVLLLSFSFFLKKNKKSGQSRRFQPKPKLQVYRERYDTIIPDSNVGESVSCQPDSHTIRSEMDFVGNEKEHGLPAADALDYSARGFDNNIITESAHEFPVHEEYVAEASLSDAGNPTKHSEATSQMPEEPVSP